MKKDLNHDMVRIHEPFILSSISPPVSFGVLECSFINFFFFPSIILFPLKKLATFKSKLVLKLYETEWVGNVHFLIYSKRGRKGGSAGIELNLGPWHILDLFCH